MPVRKNPSRSGKAPASPKPVPSEKQDQLHQFRESPDGAGLTTDQGVLVTSTDDSLKAGVRGPTLLEDFHLREKIMRFDHERIPERVVHARGAGAHGYFQVYESLAKYTQAGFLNDPVIKTPVFVRFSTVVGSRGSTDLARDVRGFAVKFYTQEGNFDLVGNNMPVFFIQDGIKFPDLIHAVKPNPKKEIPQAASAHDSFWDFVSLTPETAHMVMWVMSDRALPRSYRMMEGFGVHTFRLVDASGKASLVKWHWKPVLGMHSLLWEEAQMISGKDPDFHRRDLWEAIASGNPVEYELGLQVVAESDALAYGFDMLDPTKLLPEEIVPVELVGKMTLDRNPENFFTEVEQVAFCVGNVVPGIDFTNDPLMQARLFSYLDTQITRLGGPNFAELPINRPLKPVHNNQHDGFGRTIINTGAANYLPNSLGEGFPKPTPPEKGGYAHYAERMDGAAIRARSPSFSDHFSQARMFLNSLSTVEREHLTDALIFELGHCERLPVRQRVVDAILANIDPKLAATVAAAIGIPAPSASASAKAPAKSMPAKAGKTVDQSPKLSLMSTTHDSIRTRRIAVLAGPGCVGASLTAMVDQLQKEGATVEVVSLQLGPVATADGKPIAALRSFPLTASVLYDAVAIADGADSVKAMAAHDVVMRFVQEANRHRKAIAAIGEGSALLAAAKVPAGAGVPGIVTGAWSKALGQDFVTAISAHRHWQRGAPKH